MNPAAPAADRAGDSVPISALQHWLYCPRQCALIHVERIWAENRFTAEGRVLHARPDAGRAGRRAGVRILRGVEIASEIHGLHGVADVVELHGRPPRPFPVEYKRGRPKAHRADEVQLCAQALCLEEMFGCEVAEGALFYGATRRRTPVHFDAMLRALVLEAAEAVRALIASGRLPPPLFEKRKCGSCSLVEACRPRLRRGARAWLARMIAAGETPA